MMRELFGDQQLRVFQSSLPGMTYSMCISKLSNGALPQQLTCCVIALTHQPNNFAVHVGYEGNEMVIIAKARGLELRLIPENIFHDSSVTWDLPAPLIEGHFHWL